MMEPVNSSSLGAMGSLLRKLDELLCSEDRAQGLIGDLRIIRTKMEKLSEVHSPPHTVKYWMNDARELSYDMEVCVDLFVHASQPEYLPAKVAWILAWIKEILGFEARVKEVNERCERYNLVNRYVLSNPAKILLSHHLGSLYEEPNPVGMEEPTNKILEWMMPMGHTEEDPKLKVVSILGDEGVGKSTLVKRLWQESSQDKFEFQCRAFVQMAKKPDTRMILRTILSQVRPKQPLKACKVPKLIGDLREYLQDKRYFIVIDDLWDVSVWHIVRRAFPAGNDQRIITTTTVENAARVCCSYDSNRIVNVKCLGTDQAKNLFVDRAFGSEKGCPPQFNDFTDEITRKCGGFPLAIICTARHVASQPETEQEQQLNYVTKFLPNNLSTHSSMEILNQVLKLCYSSLPHCLKTCLLYLSVYPENYLFLKEDLVKQWIAEDFICTPEEKDIVDVAGSYFDELLSLGLIQLMDIIVNSNKKGSLSHTVHPAVFDFITCKSMEDNFITIIDYSQSAVVLSEKVRRLSLHFGSATYATTPESVELSQVRSLSFIGLLGCLPSIAEFKLVRVMILHICSDDMDTRFSLSEICHLLQLRYLQVRCNITVELPKQMQCLKHLGTLDINAGVEDIPSDIVHLLRLWHVRLGEKTKRTPGQISSVDWSGLPCPSISLESFELLHPICIFSTLPQWFIQLRRLRNLEIVVRQLSKDIEALAELPVLKHLSLYVRTPLTAAIILSSGMFPALEYFKFACGVLPLGFQNGTLPNLRRLKLVFNAQRGACSYRNILVGIEHLLSLQKVAGSIGLAPGAVESDWIAAETAFKDAIRKHPCYPSLEPVKRVDPVDEDWNQQGEGKSSNERRGQVPKWKLAFQSPTQLSIFTGLKIEDYNGNPLKVILLDPDTGSPSALPSPLSIELVPLLGDFQHHEDWTADEFEKAILREPEGMRPLLTGDIRLTMWNGHATVGELKFTDNSSWVHSLKVRIGARVVPGSYDGGRIIEAVTEALRPVQLPSLSAEAAAMVKGNLVSVSNDMRRMVRETIASMFSGRLPLWKLAFRTPPHLPVFTGSKIEDEAGEPLEVILVDADTGSPSTLPQSLRVELVPVFGDFLQDGREDWSADEFQRNVVKERQGKCPLLTGDVNLTLREGRATVGELQFTDNSSWVPCGKFRIGARVVPGSYDGARIAEAITQAFMVKDHRGEMFRKHYPPVLGDSVWRLERIGKEGAFHRKLRHNKIETVQEFLMMLAVKPEDLRTILGDNMTDPIWEAVTTHAKTCDPGNKVYTYSSAGCTIYVNSVFNLVKVEIGGIECPLQQLNGDQTMLVRQLILQAYEKRDNLMEQHYPPSLGDSVWVLENITKEGTFHNNLERNNIKTVQDFLRMLMVKPDQLRKILGDGMTNDEWEVTTKHARTCVPGDKVYVYTAGGGTIYVNSVFNLVKVEIGGTECPLQQLNWDQMMLVLPLIMEAYEQRHNLQETNAVTFDGNATDNIALLRARFEAQARAGPQSFINNMVPNPWVIQ